MKAMAAAEGPESSLRLVYCSSLLTVDALSPAFARTRGCGTGSDRAEGRRTTDAGVPCASSKAGEPARRTDTDRRRTSQRHEGCTRTESSGENES